MTYNVIGVAKAGASLRRIFACVWLLLATSSVVVAAEPNDALLQQLAAERDIGRLMTDYTWLLDKKDFDGYGKLFAHGALLDAKGNTIAKGEEAVAGLVRKYLGGNPDIKVRHVVTSPRIDVDLDKGTASATSFLLTVQAPQGKPASLFRVANYYDKFQRVDGHWQFESRQEVTDWVLQERTLP